MEPRGKRRRTSPPIFITLAVAAAAAALTTAVAISMHPAPVTDVASPAAVVAPVSGSTPSAEPSHDPSLPSPAKVFEHPPAADDGEASTF